MKSLIIDTSTLYLYTNFYDSDKKEDFYSKAMATHNNHSENLLPAIENGLKEFNIELKDFDSVYCGIGPGSYTGLRVGCVVAKMFSYTLNKPMYFISSLLFIGSGYLKNDGIYAISSVAKKGYKYLTIVKVNNGNIEILLNDTFLSNEEYENEINKYELTIVDESNYKIDSEIIIKLSNKVEDIHSLVPNYLRSANS